MKTIAFTLLIFVSSLVFSQQIVDSVSLADMDEDSDFIESTNALNIEMVFVKGGSFTMGSENDSNETKLTARNVVVSDFFISKYEITQTQWNNLVRESDLILYSSFYSDCDECPVESVSWYDVQNYLDALFKLTGEKYRLPTEAEWEYAARGGSMSKSTMYAGGNCIDTVGWYQDNTDRTNYVGEKDCNELGIYDMSGNVWEWCGDYYGDVLLSNVVDPTGVINGTFRVARGGGFNCHKDFCTVYSRGSFLPESRESTIGFRVVVVK
jgi:formylglycine-generating enzyme